MNTKKAKKLRKLHRKELRKLAEQGYELALHKMGKKRDIWAVFAVVELLIIIGGVAWIIFR